MRRRICLLLFVVYLGTAGYCQEGSKYTVKEGDTAAEIARQHGIDLEDLKRWNNIEDIDRIKIGQELWIRDNQSIQQEPLEKPEQVNETIVNLEETTAEEKKDVANPNTDVSPQQTKQEREGVVNKVDEKEIEKGEAPEKPTSQSHSWVWLLFGLLTGLALGVMFVYVFCVKKLKAELESKENELYQANSRLSTEKTNVNTELSRLRSKIQTLEREKRELLDENVGLGEEIDRLKAAPNNYLNENSKMELDSNSSKSSNHATASSVTLYADAIIDGYFVRVREIPNEDSIFVMLLNGEGTATFEVYESAYNRVVANPSFLEGCEKQIIGESLRLEIISKGVAQRDFSNGKWKIINKLNVIIR
ncbi:MAG: LysM peptidoglycan-binding domain-containing protein [Bacteroidales bacterium]|nr:LysM peptidoglycan-binding domain-containing protein [Bacteroidales bacterium]